ncbi:MAG: hypothetical protein IPI01_10390 [Ignavibacteriae bacterium]|nr:hypothetical protein [Ignavibacteriota bacterium]
MYSIHRDRNGTLWVGTREGLEEFQPATETFRHHRHVEGDPTSLSDNWVWPILEDRAGDLWIGTFGRIEQVRPRNENLHAFPPLRERSAEPGW